MRKASKEIYSRIGSKGDYIRAMKLTGKDMHEVKRMNAMDVFEILSLDNVMNI